MNKAFTNLRINTNRFKRDFIELSKIGMTIDGGVDRPALTVDHLKARKWFQNQIESDGFLFKVDSAGNHSAIFSNGNLESKTILLGSHLDSVPNGGKYDGALGVLAAYEVLRSLSDTGITLPFHIEAIDFTDEEGTIFGLLGSRAFVGSLSVDDLMYPRCGKANWENYLINAQLTEEGILHAERDLSRIAGFLELHIEQGPILEKSSTDIGIVDSIVGINSLNLTFLGKADHAGTTPMHLRRDAGLGAAAFILKVRELVMESFRKCVVNIGQARFEPGAFNIVPEKAELSVEFRSPDNGELNELEKTIITLAQKISIEYDLEVSYSKGSCVGAVKCSEKIKEGFLKACQNLNLSFKVMDSGAGHDTMALAKHIPAGMIFVPSSGGSHNPKEYAGWESCVNGANVLLGAVAALIEYLEI